MSESTASPSTFSGDELRQLFELMSDGFELKLTVPGSEQRAAVAALGLNPREAQAGHVFLFDTPELALDRQGVDVCARRVQSKGDDSAVKLRPVIPSELPDDLRRSANFRVEVDALPGGFVCSAAVTRALRKTDIRSAVAGEFPLRKLFSKEQRAFFAAHVQDGVGLDDLSILGPICILKYRSTPHRFERELTAELWLYPDRARILELSIRCDSNESFHIATELRNFLTTRGIDLSGEQQTTAKKALEFFSQQLKRQRSVGGSRNAES